ncbi:MAG: SET domain-containing protein [Candidatus Kapabacteria bacterium]|nr:SET domain-containing protein [Candidatus Kapabacteria bacterium]
MKRHSIRVTARCAHVGPRGRCAKNTTITHPYCGKHTAEVLGLRVAKSRVPNAGLGLYAVRTFKKGEHIVEYTGQRMSIEDYDAKYAQDGLGSYGIEVNADTVIDAAKTSSSVARYACDYHGSGKRGPNARYESDDVKVWIVALKTIRPGEEIFTDYGHDMHLAIGII